MEKRIYLGFIFFWAILCFHESSLFAQIETQIDYVGFGYSHWNQASGDTEPDDGDIDNSFGEHKGRGIFVKIEEARFVIAKSNTGYIQWDFYAPSSGEYKITLKVIKGSDRSATLLYLRNNVWEKIAEVVGTAQWEEVSPNYSLNLSAGTNTFKLEAKSDWFYAHWVRLSKMESVAPYLAVHPILHFRVTDIPSLKAKIQRGALAGAFEQLQKNLNNYTNPNNRNYLDLNNPEWQQFIGGEVHREREKILEDLMLGYILTDNTTYRELALGIIEKALGWEDWYAGQWLARAEFTSVMAEAYDWFHTEITNRGLKEPLKHAIVREAKELYNTSIQEEGWASVTYLANWKAVCHGALGLVGLTLKGEVPEADQWIQRAKEKLQEYMRSWFDKDGATMESYDYYYGFPMSYLLNFFNALKRVTGDDQFGYMDNIIQKSIPYSIAFLRPQRDGHNTFDDVSLTVTKPHIMALLASRYNDGLAQWHYQYVTGEFKTTQVGWNNAHMTHQFFWYDDTIPIEYPDRSPRMSPAMLYKDFGRLTLRTGYESTNDIQLSMECGHFGGGHGHPDQGSFVFNAYGNCLIEDPAPPVSYGSPLHQYIQSPEAHNTILIAGRGQMASSGDVYSKVGSIDVFLHTDFLDYVQANSKMAYDKGANTVERALRHVVFVRPLYFIVIDDIQKDTTPHKYDFLLHTDVNHTISYQGNNNFIFDGIADLNIQMIEPQAIRYSVENKSNLGYNANFLRVWPETNPIRGLFCTLLYPKSSAMTMPTVKKIYTGNLSGIEVSNNDLILLSKTDDSYTYGDITCNAQFLIRRKTDKDALDYFFIQKGSIFGYNNHVFFSADKNLQAVAIHYATQENGIHGYLVGPDSTTSYTVLLNTQNIIPQKVQYNETELDFTFTNGVVQFVASGLGKLQINGIHEKPDDIPPNAPSNLQGTPAKTESSILLNWNASEPASDGDTASAYIIFRNDSLVGTSEITLFSDTHLKEDTPYQYKIYSLDDAGNRSDNPATGVFKTLDITPPLAPTHLIATTQNETSITLNWNESPPASDGDKASFYRIFRNNNLIGTTDKTTFSDIGLMENTQYHYAIYAVDDADNQSVNASSGDFRTLGISRNTIDKSLNASLSLGSPLHSKPKTLPILLLVSKQVVKIPSPIILIESDSSKTEITLNGAVPGNNFSGILTLDESVADGPARFLLPKESLIDLEGNKGNSIVQGDSIYIDKTPPASPIITRIK